MKRRFIVMVDSGSPDEPNPRRFGSLDMALEAVEETDKAWHPFLWLIEEAAGGQNFVHIRDGQAAGGDPL